MGTTINNEDTPMTNINLSEIASANFHQTYKVAYLEFIDGHCIRVDFKNSQEMYDFEAECDKRGINNWRGNFA